MNKRQVRGYLYSIYKLLKSDAIKVYLVKINNKNAGENEGSDIRLSPQADLLPTVIHESLHILFPDWEDEKICLVEKSICETLSQRQWFHLFDLTTKAIYHTKQFRTKKEE